MLGKYKAILAGIGGIFSIVITGLMSEDYLQNKKNINFDQWKNPHLYSGSFLEERFPIRAIKRKSYSSRVEQGYANMQQSRVVICGLARNISENISTISRRIDQMGALFKDYKVLIFENDSEDQTRQLLYEWQEKNPHIQMIETEVKDNKFGELAPASYGALSSNRIAKMAYFRNYYIREIEQKYADYDYMLVVDMDLKGPWSLDGLANTFGHNDWDMVGSYGLISFPGSFATVYAMYDNLAYVPQYEEWGGMVDQTYMAKTFLHINFVQLRNVKKGDNFVPVKSCFAGMGVYKMKSIKGCYYTGGRCEHIEFHKQMAEHGHGNIFMNPSQILLSGHQGPRPSELFSANKNQPTKLNQV